MNKPNSTDVVNSRQETIEAIQQEIRNHLEMLGRYKFAAGNHASIAAAAEDKFNRSRSEKNKAEYFKDVVAHDEAKAQIQAKAIECRDWIMLLTDRLVRQTAGK